MAAPAKTTWSRTKQNLKIWDRAASSLTDRPSVKDSAANMCSRQSRASRLQMWRQLFQLGRGKAAWRGVQGHLPLPGFISGKHEQPHMAPCGQQWPGWGADYPLFWRIRTPVQPPHSGRRLALTEGWVVKGGFFSSAVGLSKVCLSKLKVMDYW